MRARLDEKLRIRVYLGSPLLPKVEMHRKQLGDLVVDVPLDCHQQMISTACF